MRTSIACFSIACISIVASSGTMAQEAEKGALTKSAIPSSVPAQPDQQSSAANQKDPPAKGTTQLSAGAQQAAATIAKAKTETFKVPPGYLRRVRNGETYYCQKTVVLGSRFPKEICMTEPELVDFERRNQSMRDSMTEKNRICSGAAGCAVQ